MKRTWGYRLGTIAALAYFFFARDMGRPDAVAGATRRAAPLRAPAPQPDMSSLPAPMTTPAVKATPPPVPAPVPPEPEQPLVAAPQAQRSSPVVVPGLADNKANYRTFEGRVESVMDQEDGPGQVVRMVNAFGEHFTCVFSPETLVYSGEDHALPAKPLGPGDRIFVRYLLHKENAAIEVRID